MKTFIFILFVIIVPMSTGIISAAFGIFVTKTPLLYLAINIPVCGISVLVGILLMERRS